MTRSCGRCHDEHCSGCDKATCGEPCAEPPPSMPSSLSPSPSVEALADEFEWGCDSIEHVAEALLAARKGRDEALAECDRLAATYRAAETSWAQQLEHVREQRDEALDQGRREKRLREFVQNVADGCFSPAISQARALLSELYPEGARGAEERAS